MFQGFKVLDLTDHKGFLCGKILGDFGADVIKIEMPGGDSSRNTSPFYHDNPDSEKSIYWFAFNNNKRGITLNYETPYGLEIFKKLSASAQFVIESFPPGYTDKLGLGYSELSKLNPRLVYTSITPFGQTGPYKNYKASDLIIMAMSGSLYINGEPDKPPVGFSSPFSYLFGSVHAAIGTLIAHYYRESTGEGQFVDVSIQQCIATTLHNTLETWEARKQIVRRTGIFYEMRPDRTTGMKAIWHCRDGYVCFILFGGILGGRINRQLTSWMESEGNCPDFMKEIQWESMDMTAPPRDILDRASEYIADFFLRHSKAELLEGALKWRVALYPVWDPADILASVQLAARNFWQEVEHPELGQKIRYPGAFVKSSQTPLKLRYRAPLIGEHNNEVYEELGFTKEELLILKQSRII